MTIIKSTSVACMLLLSSVVASAQTKPCDKWLTDFIQVNPKMSDGSRIDKYITQQLTSDTSLKSKANCMVGMQVYVNCKGEFSYEKMDYRNNPAQLAQCNDLLKKTEAIMNGVKTLSPGTIEGKDEDFVFKLVVKIKANGKPVTELLY